MQVVGFSIIRFGSVFVPMAHKLDISEFWCLSTYPLWITFILLFSIQFQYFSHRHKFLYSISLTFRNKWRDAAEDVSRLEVTQHALYVTGDHVAAHATYKHLQSVHCDTESQTTKHDLHTAIAFVSRLCGSNRILLAGFSVL